MNQENENNEIEPNPIDPSKPWPQYEDEEGRHVINDQDRLQHYWKRSKPTKQISTIKKKHLKLPLKLTETTKSLARMKH